MEFRRNPEGMMPDTVQPGAKQKTANDYAAQNIQLCQADTLRADWHSTQCG